MNTEQAIIDEFNQICQDYALGTYNSCDCCGQPLDENDSKIPILRKLMTKLKISFSNERLQPRPLEAQDINQILDDFINGKSKRIDSIKTF